MSHKTANTHKIKQGLRTTLYAMLLAAMTLPLTACGGDDSTGTKNADIIAITFKQSVINLNNSTSTNIEIKAIIKGTNVSATDWYNNSANPYALTWSTKNRDVAEVDQSGKVTGKSPGSTIITVTAVNGVKASTPINVIDAGLASRLGAPLSPSITFSKGVQLERNTVLQCFDVDTKSDLYYVQLGGAHELYVQHAQANARPTDHMILRWFGHGTNIAVEEQGVDRYIWINSNGTKMDDRTYSQNRTFSRFKYEAGKTLDYHSGETFFMNDKYNIHPALDTKNDILAITCSAGTKREFYFYKLSEAKAIATTKITLSVKSGGEVSGFPEKNETREVDVHVLDRLSPLSSFSVTSSTDKNIFNSYSFQGFDIQDGIVYFYEGEGNGHDGKAASNAYVTLLDMKGNVAQPRTKVAAIADLAALTAQGFTSTGYMEAEGIKMKHGSLYIGFASKSTDEVRRANIFKY